MNVIKFSNFFKSYKKTNLKDKNFREIFNPGVIKFDIDKNKEVFSFEILSDYKMERLSLQNVDYERISKVILQVDDENSTRNLPSMPTLLFTLEKGDFILELEIILRNNFINLQDYRIYQNSEKDILKFFLDLSLIIRSKSKLNDENFIIINGEKFFPDIF